MLHETVGEGPGPPVRCESLLLHMGCSPARPRTLRCDWLFPQGPGVSRSCGCGGRKEGSLESLGEKVLCPRVGLTLIFMLLIYTVPSVEANASCMAVYIVHL